MRNLSSKLLIFAFTFLFSVGGLLVWFYLFPEQESFDEVDISALPTIEYCELRNVPGKYSGKVVRVNADMYWFMHGLFLYDVRCGNNTSNKHSDDHRTAISYYEPKSDEIMNFLAPFKPFDQKFRFKITAVGRFVKRRPTGFTDSIEDRTSFHFEVFQIEKVEKILN